MALRFIDGFDHYTSDDQLGLKYNETASSAYLDMSTGRRAGSNSLRLYSASGYVTKSLDDQSTWIVGAAVKISAVPNSLSSIIQFRDSSGYAQGTVCIGTSGNITLTRGSSTGTALVTSSNALPVGVWNYIEARLTIADSGGTFEVRVNGETWATYTGDTKYSSSLNTASSIRLYALTPAVYVWIDDLYICDGTGSQNNGFLGDVRVDTLFPSGTGASAGFTPTGSANNWENVDDATPDDDTSYNAGDTAGQTDSFTFADLTSLNSTIFGVQENMIARKDDAGTRLLRGVARLGGVNYEGSDMTLSDSYQDYRQIWEKNPATAANWSESDINAAEFGYKVQA